MVGFSACLLNTEQLCVDSSRNVRKIIVCSFQWPNHTILEVTVILKMPVRCYDKWWQNVTIFAFLQVTISSPCPKSLVTSPAALHPLVQTEVWFQMFSSQTGKKHAFLWCGICSVHLEGFNWRIALLEAWRKIKLWGKSITFAKHCITLKRKNKYHQKQLWGFSIKSTHCYVALYKQGRIRVSKSCSGQGRKTHLTFMSSNTRL